ERVKNLLRKWYVAARDWLMEPMRKPFKRDRASAGDSCYGWIVAPQFLLYALVAALVIGLLVLLHRVPRGWRPHPAPLQSAAIPSRICCRSSAKRFRCSTGFGTACMK